MPKRPIKYFTKINQLGWSVSVLIALIFASSPFIALIIKLIEVILLGELQFAGWLGLGGRRWTLFVRSVLWAGGVGLGGIVLAVLAVFGLNSRLPKQTYRWIWFLLVLTCLPAYVQAIAWQTFAQWLGVGYLAHGWFVSGWVQLMVFFPLAVVMVYIGVNTVDSAAIEAARLHYSDFKIFWSIWLPLTAPYLLAGGSILFVLALVDYTIPSLFQVNTYPLEIFAEFSASGRPESALLLAIPLILITLVVLFGVVSRLKPVGIGSDLKRPSFELTWDWPRILEIFQTVALGLLMMQFFLPLVTLVVTMQKQRQFLIPMQESSTDLAYSVMISAAAALFAVLFALPVSRFLVFSKRRLMIFISVIVLILPLAVPASLVGVGIIALLNRPTLSFLYGTDFGLILCLTVRFFPIAVLVITGQFQRAGMAWIEAAKLLDANLLRRFVRIILPISAPTILAAFLFVLALSLGELGASLLVVPPGRSTFTIRIYNYLHYGAGETVAGMSLWLVLLVIGLGVLAILGLQLQDRQLPEAE
jgi:iron(III) transport system permease protein